MDFHHIGLRSWEKRAGENYVAKSKVWVTDPREHPNRIEWLRYEPDSPTPEVVKDTPHVAFSVDQLEPYLRDEEVVIEPFKVGDFAKVAFIAKHGLVYEFMEFKAGRVWFGE
jgi:hypothetical protein